MSIREKTKDRVIFDIDKKKKVLHKSKGVCAHCGKKLTLEDMTVDHVIPLSKGGGNDLKNLVALCEKCNKDKSNYVVQPEEYFNYLDWVYLENLHKEYKKYYEDIDWVSKRQIFSEDRKDVNSMNSLGMWNKSTYFYKANYSDLDDIYYAYIKYHDRKCNRRYDSEDKKSLKEFISFIFNNGCLYVLRNSCDDVAVVVPVILTLLDNGEDLLPLCFFTKILMVYKKPEFSSAFMNFFTGLVAKGLKWNIACIVEARVSVFHNNDLLENTIRFIAANKFGSTDILCSKEAFSFETVLYSGLDDVYEVYEGNGGKLDNSLKEDILNRIEGSVFRAADFFEDIGVVKMKSEEAGYFLAREV